MVLLTYSSKRVLGTTLLETIVSTVIILVAFMLFSMVWAQISNSGNSSSTVKVLYAKMPISQGSLMNYCQECKLVKEEKSDKVSTYKIMKNGHVIMTYDKIIGSNIIDSLFDF